MKWFQMLQLEMRTVYVSHCLSSKTSDKVFSVMHTTLLFTLFSSSLSPGRSPEIKYEREADMLGSKSYITPRSDVASL